MRTKKGEWGKADRADGAGGAVGAVDKLIEPTEIIATEIIADRDHSELGMTVGRR